MILPFVMACEVWELINVALYGSAHPEGSSDIENSQIDPALAGDDLLGSGDGEEISQNWVFVGAFIQGIDSNPDDYAIENRLSISCSTVSNTCNGTGTLVILDPPLFDGDVKTNQTYNLDFSGTYDPGTGQITGSAYITGAGNCLENCSGVDNYLLEPFYSGWNAILTDSGKKMDGEVVQGLGAWGKYSATR